MLDFAPNEEEINARFLDAFNTPIIRKEWLLDEYRTTQAVLTNAGSPGGKIPALFSEIEAAD